MAKVLGFNHLTLAVRDLDRSIAFYTDVLGLRLRARWSAGAYLDAGALWLCLAHDPMREAPERPDYTHVALTVELDDFAGFSAAVGAVAPIWKANTSEGPSLYVLDPDGHRLELHAGTLASRLAHYRANPLPDRVLYD